MTKTRVQPTKSWIEGLKRACVPLADETLEDLCGACNGCETSYPSRFGAEETSEVYGSVKPFARIVLCATNGKEDWQHDVAEEKGSLAHLLDKARSATPSSKPGLLSKLKLGKATMDGIHEPGSSNKVTILNSSIFSAAHSGHETSILVLPDFKLISNIALEADATQQLFDSQLAGPSTPSPSVRSWSLPYRAVILLCASTSATN